MLNGRWPHGLSTWNWVRNAKVIRDPLVGAFSVITNLRIAFVWSTADQVYVLAELPAAAHVTHIFCWPPRKLSLGSGLEMVTTNITTARSHHPSHQRIVKFIVLLSNIFDNIFPMSYLRVSVDLLILILSCGEILQPVTLGWFAPYCFYEHILVLTYWKWKM